MAASYSVMPVNYPGPSTGSWDSGAYGGVPEPVNPQSAQTNAITGNLSNVSNLYNLATGVGGASGAGAAGNLNAVLPGATAGLGGGLNFANQEISGQLPADVITQLQQQGAEHGVATGMPGSPNSNAAYLRALGLTSLGMGQQGVKDLSTIIGSTPIGPQFNPQSQLLDPAQQLEQQNYNSALGAAPNPAAAAKANLAALYSGKGAAGGGAAAPNAAADNFWQTDPNSWWMGGGTATPDVSYGGGGGGTPAAQPFDYSNLGSFPSSDQGMSYFGNKLPVDENGNIDYNALANEATGINTTGGESSYME